MFNFPIDTKKYGVKLVSEVIHEIVCRGNFKDYTDRERSIVCQGVMDAVGTHHIPEFEKNESGRVEA